MSKQISYTFSPGKYINAQNVTAEDKKHIISTFHRCDSGQRGKLIREDVKIAVACLFAYKPSKYEVDEMLQTDNEMTLARFEEVMTLKMAMTDEDDSIRRTFMSFDTQCHGFLTMVDIKKVFSIVAPHMPHHVVESTFREIDRDGDGRISFADFEFMMKYSAANGL